MEINKFLFGFIIIIGCIILINVFGMFVMTGKAIDNILYESDSNFSTGTFTNTTPTYNTIRLNKPVPVGSYTDSSPPYSVDAVYGIFVLDDFAYVMSYDDDCLTILNVTNKSNPIATGSYNDSVPPYSLENPQQVFVLDDFAYVPSWADDSLTILNVSNKSNPTPVGNYTSSVLPYSLYGALAVFVLDDFAYVVATRANSLTIFNVTNKSHPIAVGNYTGPSIPYSVFVLEDHAYLISSGNDSLLILNVTNKSNPTLLGSYNDSEPPYSLDEVRGVFVLEDYAYLTSWNDDCLTILNVSNKSNPTPVGSYNDSEPPYSLDKPAKLHVSGDYAYVPSYEDDSVTILNISNKSDPTPVGSYNDSDTPYSLDRTYGLYFLDDYIYSGSFLDNSFTILKDEFFSTGTYESEIYNATFTAKWISISWEETKPSGTSLSLAFRSCDDASCSGESFGSYYTDSSHFLDEISNNMYFQFKAKLETTNASITPQLNLVNISYSNDTTAPTISFSCTPSSLKIGQTITCTCSGSDTSGIGSTSYTANPSISSVGTFSTTCTVLDSVRNSATATVSYTVTSSGGGSSSTSGIQETHLWTTIIPGIATIMKNFDEEIGIEQIQIEVHSEAQDVKLTVTKHDDNPAGFSVENSGEVYQYFQIETENLEDKLDTAVITIRVNKSWISDNNLDANNITLFKFNESLDEWEELTTTFTEENETYYYYDVELNSFSYFIINEKVNIEVEEIEELEKEESIENIGKILFWILTTIFVIVMIIIIVVLGRRRKQNKKP